MGQDVENLGESVQDTGGKDVQPSTPTSPEPEVKPTSLKADDQLETAEERITRLEAYVRSLQGDKDRGVNKALEGVDQLTVRVDEVEKYAKMLNEGKTKEQVRREMALDDMVDERIGTQVVQEPVGSQAVEPSGFDADKFLREQGIDPNSAEAIKLIRDGGTTTMDYYNFALGQKTTPVLEPNVGQIMPVGTGGVVGEPDVVELTARLRELQKEPSKHLEERKKIMKELKKLTPQK